MDDGHGHYTLLTGQTSDFLDLFLFPPGGGELLTIPPPGLPALMWLTAGNGFLTDLTNNFLGTTDNTPLRIVTGAADAAHTWIYIGTDGSTSLNSQVISVPNIPTAFAPTNFLFSNGGNIAMSTFPIISGSGTLNYIPKWTPDGATLGNSLLTDDGTTLIYNANFSVDAGTGNIGTNGSLTFPNLYTFSSPDQNDFNLQSIDNNFNVILNTDDAGLGQFNVLLDGQLQGGTPTFQVTAATTTVGSPTVTVANIPSGSSATDVVVSNAGNLETRTAASLAALTSWQLGGNTAPSSNIFGTLDGTDVNMEANGNTMIFLQQATGIVGVGTSSPNSEVGKLNVVSPAGGPYGYGDVLISHENDGGLGATLGLSNPNATTGTAAALQFDVDGTDLVNPNAEIRAINMNGGANNATDLAFSIWNGGADQEVMRVANNGDVGLGFTTPNAILSFGLHPIGTALIHLWDGGAIDRYGFGINASELQSFLPTGAHFSWNGGSDIQPEGTNELMRLDATNVTLSVGNNTTAFSAQSNSDTKLRLINSATDPWDYGVDEANLNGQFGHGYIESEWDQFHIYLDADNNYPQGSEEFALYRGQNHANTDIFGLASPTQIFKVDGFGNVTVGNLAASVSTTIVTSNAGVLEARSAASLFNGWSLGGNTGSSPNNQLGTLDATDLSIVTGAAGPNTRMTISGTTGNVGINTTVPGEQLEVMNGNVLISNNTHTAGGIHLQGTGAGYTALVAGAQDGANITYTLPTANGAAGTVLSTDGGGPAQLSWISGGAFFFIANSNGNVVANDYFYDGAGQNAVEAQTEIIIPRAGHLRNLYVNLANAPGGATSRTFTVRQNGVNTALHVTFNGALGGTLSDNVDAIVVSAGDLISIQNTVGGAPAASGAIIGFEIIN